MRRNAIHKFLFRLYKCNQLLTILLYSACFTMSKQGSQKLSLFTFEHSMPNRCCIFIRIFPDREAPNPLSIDKSCLIGPIIAASISLECHPKRAQYHQLLTSIRVSLTEGNALLTSNNKNRNAKSTRMAQVPPRTSC